MIDVVNSIDALTASVNQVKIVLAVGLGFIIAHLGMIAMNIYFKRNK